MKLQRQKVSAFSLLEVLVASAVLSVVMVILLGTLSASMSLWRNTENKLIADREGRAAELLISQDLSSAVLPANPNLWPRVQNNVLQFLTAKPVDYQDPAAGDIGDVCYVEYYLSPDKSALLRNFYGSAWTYQNVLRGGQFRAAPSVADGQLLATNLLSRMADSVRGLEPFINEASEIPFIVLVTNNASQSLLPYQGGPYAANNPPVAVEVNVAAADPEAIANKDLLNNPNYKLRNAGYYSFRVPLPPPPSQ